MTGDNIDISVIVCTYNRAAILSRCLAHLAAQQVIAGVRWEVIVVDNNSTDHTPQVVKDAGKDGLPVRYSREAYQGLCYARNRGIDEARGEIIAYIDDDIFADKAWLAGMISAFRETECAAAGGRIHLETGQKPLPPWLSQALWGYLGYIDHGERRIVLDGNRYYPHGGNMAFRRQVFQMVGLFNVAIGRKGNKLFKGSETEFFQRLALTGAEIVYEPAAKVHHLIKPNELSKRHFRILQLRNGEQRAKTETVMHRRTIMGVPLFLGREFAKAFRDYAMTLSKEPGVRFRREMDLWNLAGYVRGEYSMHRNGCLHKR